MSHNQRNFILLSPGMIRGINYLIETRHHSGINTQNQALFYSDNSGPMDCTHCVQLAVDGARDQLKSPDALVQILWDRSYISTLSMVSSGSCMDFPSTFSRFT